VVVEMFPGFEAGPPLCRLAASPLRPPRLPQPLAGRRRRRRRIRGDGTRNLLSLPGDNKDNDGWGDGNNKGATLEPILRVLHDQSHFVPGSTMIFTLVNHPLLDANFDG
jgi:hypothetical protein